MGAWQECCSQVLICALRCSTKSSVSSNSATLCLNDHSRFFQNLIQVNFQQIRIDVAFQYEIHQKLIGNMRLLRTKVLYTNTGISREVTREVRPKINVVIDIFIGRALGRYLSAKLSACDAV